MKVIFSLGRSTDQVYALFKVIQNVWSSMCWILLTSSIGQALPIENPDDERLTL